MNQDQRRLLALAEARLAAGKDYASYTFAADARFLEVSAKEINRKAGSRGKARVIFDGNRAPFLTYEGTDRSDMGFEFTASLWMTDASTVRVNWWGETVVKGRFDFGKSLKVGQLYPSLISDTWAQIAGF